MKEETNQDPLAEKSQPGRMETCHRTKVQCEMEDGEVITIQPD